MKHLKTFESHVEGMDDGELFNITYMQNPLSSTHDMYAFIYKDGFKELENGDYKKTLEIEKMHQITPDSAGLNDMVMMNMRARMNMSIVGVIWWFKDAAEMIKDKGSKDMDLHLIELIDKHKSDSKGSHGRKTFNNIKDTLNKTQQYDI